MKKTYYTNGVNEKRLLPDEKIPDGWYKGRVKSSATTTGCIWINDGISAKFIPSEDKIPDGWVKGRLMSHLNVEKGRKTKLEKKYKHYTDGINDFIFSADDVIPSHLRPGRPPMSQVCKDKLSVSHIGKHHTEEAKKKISLHSNNNRVKAFKTIIDTYGNMDSYYEELHNKVNETKRKHNTFNTSKPEVDMYNLLCNLYGKNNVMRQYKDKDRYPFYCDFYIKPLDKFIELNLHWTHGSRPYVAQDEFCQKQLLEWREKAKTSQFYQNAIKTWTVRDVEKQKVAKENNLNYEVIY